MSSLAVIYTPGLINIGSADAGGGYTDSMEIT
jgi:hypothetical protein